MDEIHISLISLLLAVLGYALWYLFMFHQWCPAMWFGTAPPIIILTAFVSIRQFLVRMGGPPNSKDKF